MFMFVYTAGKNVLNQPNLVLAGLQTWSDLPVGWFLEHFQAGYPAKPAKHHHE